MNDVTIGAVLGIALGLMLSGLIEVMNPISYRNVHLEAVSVCEKELPRSQTCVIIAVPKQAASK